MKSGGQGSMSEIHRAILNNFGKSTRALTNLLEEDASFGTVEQVLIENHIHVIRVAFGTWVRRNTRSMEALERTFDG